MDYLHTTSQGVQPPLAPYYLRPKENTVTEHNHTTIVEGCYRCELGMDEVTGLTNTTAREYEAYLNGHKGAEEMYAHDVVDLHERLEKAVKELEGLRAILRTDDEVGDARLRGKIEGVRLALSYVRETWRDI